MESIILFVAIIAIVVLITLFASYFPELKVPAPSRVESFTSCPHNKYRTRQTPPINYADLEKVKYGEDEDINFHLNNPLVPRIVKQRGETRNWKTFWKKKFMPGEVPKDDNFEGTSVKNYLDSIRYFHN